MLTEKEKKAIALIQYTASENYVDVTSPQKKARIDKQACHNNTDIAATV